MNFFKTVIILIGSLISLQLFAHGTDSNPNITPYNDAQESIHGYKVQHLKNHPAWQNFVAAYPSWGARFNRYTKLPHRALGKPFTFGQNNQDLVAKSLDFISTHFAEFAIPTENLIATRSYNDGKYINVNFKQLHNGMEILWSNIAVRYAQNHEIVMFGLDAHTNVPATLPVTITAQQAKQYAESNLITPIINSVVSNAKKIIPIPVNGVYTYHVVYEVMTETQDTKEMPGKYLSYVDAETGKIWYRDNDVKQIGFTVSANLYPTNLTNASQLLELPHLRVTDGASTYYTDASGNVTIPGLTFTGSIHLDGRYCDVVTGQSGTVSPFIAPAAIVNNSTYTWASFNPAPAIQHFTAYYHVNVVHDYMKTKLPAFTAMDNPLTTKVDRTDGNCNAFYNGSSINFYTTANGCNALSQVNSVIYHEYGHGISREFYNAQGANFSNGGMGEGYSDVWAMYINDDPKIGEGFGIGNPSAGIRRYDVNPKVYPADITGEVHADGEIIAGAWWDTYQYWGNIDSVSTLFAQSHYGLANGANGTEGEVYFDILIDALQYDDDDNNIANGTPHFNFIIKGFADHGIYLLNNTELVHRDLLNQNSGTAINVHVEAKTDYSPFLGDLNMVYQERGTTNSSTVLMTRNNLAYDVVFPSQTAGMVYEYYFQLSDNLNSYTVEFPKNVNTGASVFQRNIPYFVLIGYRVMQQELFNQPTAPAGWTIGNAPGDNAIRGEWDFGTPIPSFVDNADSSTLCQTYYDHNGDGQCLFTGNATSPTSAIGQEDVDGGRTTVISNTIDISTYTKPVLGYSRWYSNSQGQNPRKDWWTTQISYNGGTTWLPMERTFQPDVSWRRFVLPLIQGAGNNIMLKFIANDSAQAGMSGSIIEAALDAVEIYDIGETPLAVSNFNKLDFQLFPNPAQNNVNIVLPTLGTTSYEILTSVGQVIKNKTFTANSKVVPVAINDLSAGIYYVRVYQNGEMNIKKLTITK